MKHLHAVLFSIVLYPFTLFAQGAAPALAGWTHSGSGGSGARPGVLLEGGGVVQSSPVIADIDGVPQNGLEVAVSGSDGQLHVYRSNGTRLWQVSLPIGACGSASNRAFSSPAVGAILGNGMPYVVAGYGGFAGRACDGGVAVYRGSDGAILWNFSLKRFARRARFGTNHHAVYSTPALADTDGDGKMEIGFASLDRNVYLLSHSGRVRWYYNAADTVFSSPAFLDLDRDSRLEMVIGTDISANRHLRPPTKNGGFVYAFNTEARRGRAKRLQFQQRGSYIWRKYFDQVIQSAPSVGDIFPASPGQEIVVGSGCYFPEGSSNKRGRWLRILRSRDGRLLRTLNAPACLSSSPALGDIDGDGSLEVVATINGASGIGGDGLGRVVAWKPESSHPYWMTAPRAGGGNDSYIGQLQSPVLADLDGNGSIEVVVANQTGLAILNGRDGAVLTCTNGGCAGPSLASGGVLKSTPAIGDLNRDGVLDVVIGGQSSGRGAIFAWSRLSSVLGSPSGPAPRFSTPWPMFRQNAIRSGNASVIR